MPSETSESARRRGVPVGRLGLLLGLLTGGLAGLLMSILIGGGCSAGGWWSPWLLNEPDEDAAEDAVAVLRARLSAQMSGHRVVPYRRAWNVLADGASIGNTSIHLFYSLRVVPTDHRASGRLQNEPDYWNREHVWPQSYGLKGTPARTDIHNLVPVDRAVNSARGNKYFDELDRLHERCRYCAVSSAAWEPPAMHKGDVARITFYMDVRYEGQPESGTPDLRLSETLDAGSSQFGKLSTLLEWHCEDPVSEDERRRHDVAAKAQGNRNVFVDEPALVSSVFGAPC